MDGFGDGLVPLEGGYSGETFVADVGGERTVVRLYAQRGAARGPAAVEIDAAVLRLVRGLVPVPEVLELRRPDPVAGVPGLLVTTYLPGERLDLVLPGADTAARERLGRALGTVLGRLATMPMLRAGPFVDGTLGVGEFPPGDLVDAVSASGETLAAQLGPAGLDRLLEVADRAQDLLAGVGRVCLVHSDFNPKNLLVDPASGSLTGVLDWEFAHAGLPGTDLGNLLRFERDPVLTESVLAAYVAAVPDATEDVLDVARSADLLALLDLATRPTRNAVVDRARALLRAVALSGDLHAAP